MHFRAQVGQIPIGDASGGAVHHIGGAQNYAARESRAAKTVLAVTFTVSDRNFSDCLRRDLAQVLASRAHMHPCKHTHTHKHTILRKGRRHVRWEPGFKDWAVESWSEDDETKVCARVGACRTCHQTAPMRRVFRKVELDKLPANVTDVFFVLSNHTTPTLERSQVWPKQEALSACTSSGRFPQASR